VVSAVQVKLSAKLDVQLGENAMEVYLSGQDPLGNDSRNLFTLRYDLHYGQFDQAQFVIVPKFGKFVVHFLGRSVESAHHYHNTIFDHKHVLSPELLYARFAWALMKIVSMRGLNAKKFRFSDNDGDGGKASSTKQRDVQRGSKRPRRDSDAGEETDSNEEDGGNTDHMHDPGESTLASQIRRSEVHSPDGNAFCRMSLFQRKHTELLV
jgi:hypothetical protein